MSDRRYNHQTLRSSLWKTLREEWKIWLVTVILLLIISLFSEQLAAWLENLAFIKVLDSLSKLSLLIAALAFLREIPKWEKRTQEEARRRQLEYWKAVDAARTTQRSEDGRLYSTSLRIALEGLAAAEDADGKSIKLTNIAARGAKLDNLDLRGAHLYVCGFQEADLSKAKFCGATFEVVDFYRAKIFGCNFSNALFIKVSFTHALYDKETEFPASFNPEEHGAYLIAPGVDLQRAKLANALLQNANLKGANLQDADLSGAVMGGMNNNWQCANLKNADLKGVRAVETDLRLANLSGAKLQGANLANAKLDGANLRGTDLRGVEFITVAQIKASHFWEEAIYDQSFREALGL